MPKRRYPTYLYEAKAIKRGYIAIAGMDESGRGPLAGPVVAACVILKKRNFINKIDDSKRMSGKMRLKAYKEILENAVYNIAAVSSETIDRINIYNSTKLAMEKAYAGLRQRADYALIDGRIKPNIHCDYKSIVSGDRLSLSIACASILAKTHRDMIMNFIHLMYPKYGFDTHKGYGTIKHMRAIKKYGPTPLHRLTFAPMKHGFTKTEG